MRRRTWLQSAGLSAGLAATGAGLARLAQAADAASSPRGPADGDFKALVAVFLYGGNDGNNTLVPLDARYEAYARIRGPELALPSAQLLPLAPSNGGPAEFGMHPGLAPLAPLWAQGRLSWLLSTGALMEPVRKQDGKLIGRLPAGLQSHSDQQDLMQSLMAGPGQTTGWGYRLARALAPAPAEGRMPGLISLNGNRPWLKGDNRLSLVLPSRGRFGLSGSFGKDKATLARLSAFRSLWSGGDSPLGREASAIILPALEASARLDPVLQGEHALTTPASSAPFAELQTDLSQQLLRVARLIEARSLLGQRRPVFWVGLDGFDTHADQRKDQDRLLAELAQALAAFDAAMRALGLGSQVTSFTLSEFGRTLRPNSAHSSDHGWGSHQLVMGGAVRPQRCWGRFPDLSLGGPDDLDKDGRWIPGTAQDQVVVTLARWFGVPESARDQVVPNWRRFPDGQLGFLT